MEKNIRKITVLDFVKLIPFALFFTVLTWLVSDHIFFWDTVQLGARHGSFFYENNFTKFLLPDTMDSGHIPAFGAYLALCWKIFGKTLFVSHFALLPFLLGILWQSFILLKKFISDKYVFPALIFFLADATLLSQATLISPDVPLVFLFLLGLNSLLGKNKFLLSFALAGLVLVSMRGMMISLAFFLMDAIIYTRKENLKSILLQLLKKSFAYLPAGLIFISYNLYHYLVKGWIGYHEDSPWAESFHRVGFGGMLYNSGLLLWRLWDYGRIFLWIFTGVILLTQFKKIWADAKFKQLFLILTITLFCLSYSFISYKYLSGHRYLLPVYLVFSLLITYLLFEKIINEKIKYFLFGLLLLGSLSGNFWIYPEGISQGWDSTLAHLPYYELRNEMMQYMEGEKISIENVGCSFPNVAEQLFLELGNNRSHHPEKNLATDEYVLYSNIYNGFTDEEIKNLKKNFSLIKEFKKRGIFMELYKRTL